MEANQTEQKILFLTFDLVILNFSLMILHYFNVNNIINHIQGDSIYFLQANFSAIITYVFVPKQNFYLHDNFTTRIRRITYRIVVFISVNIVLAVLFLPTDFSRLFIFQYALAFYVGKILFHYLLFSYLRYRRSKGYFLHRALIVGHNEMSLLLRKIFDENPMFGFDFIGFVSEEPVKKEEVLGDISELERIILEHEVEILFITISRCNDMKYCKDMLVMCNKLGVRLRIVPENQYWFKSNMNLETYGSLVVFNAQEIPLDGLKARFVKRTFDVVFSLSVIVFIISWLFPIIYILIRLESKGDVIFFQKRTGINNRSFSCLKFRSMRVNGEADTKQATVNDSRITKMGEFLRKTNLDEFPQFFNVLLGHMSVVGPRPHMVKHTEQYSELIDHYKVRHYVKPGITGWAQVNGLRGVTDELWKMEKRVEYDMYYLNNWTFWWDLKIIFLTVCGKDVRKNAF